MRISTPKKYRGRQRRNLFGCRRIFFILFMSLLIAAGIAIYINRAAIQGPIEQIVSQFSDNMQQQMATQMAPPPTATQDPGNNLLSGNNFWQQGLIDEAINAYEQIEGALPNEAELFVRMATGYIMQGRIQDALTYAEKAVTADPFSSDAWAIRAWTLDWNERPGEAIASALHALELDPKNTRAMGYLAEAYLTFDQVQRAQRIIDDAMAINPDTAEVWRAQGLIQWLNDFDFDAAIQSFQHAYDLAPNLHYIAIDAAQLQFALQNYQDAIDSLDNILLTNPSNTQALQWLGIIYFSGLGDQAQASSYLYKCLQINPRNLSCNYWYGRAQMRLEEFNTAANSFEKAIELGSKDPYHWWWAGRANYVLGDCGTALSYFEPGYEYAINAGNTTLISDYQDMLRQCQSPLAFSDPESTEEPVDEEASGEEGG